VLDTDRDCQQRELGAARLGTERRRLFWVGALVSLAAPILPYLTGAWETVWFQLGTLPLGMPVRVLVFLVFFHLVLVAISLPLSYYGGYVLPRAFGLGRQSTGAWAVDWLKGALIGTLLGTAVGGVFLWTVVATGASWWWTFG
jgi:STE24 endopeptidase